MKVLWFLIRFIMGFFFTCIFLILIGLFFSAGKGYDENTALGFSGMAGSLPAIGFLLGIVWATIGILFPTGKKTEKN